MRKPSRSVDRTHQRPGSIGFLAVLAWTVLLSSCSPYETYVVPTEQIAKVTNSTGFPSVLRNSRPYILAQQSILYPGDRITTDEQSLVEIAFNDGTRARLATHTQLLIAPVQADVDVLELRVSKGAVEFIGDGETRLIIHTTTADVITNSTQFWVAYSATQNSIDIVSLTDSPIRVENSDGSLDIAGILQTTTVFPGAAPQSPIIWSESKFEEMKHRHQRISR